MKSKLKKGVAYTEDQIYSHLGVQYDKRVNEWVETIYGIKGNCQPSERMTEEMVLIMNEVLNGK